MSANQGHTSHRATVLRAIRPTDEDHRVTTFELFFDLVYVFAVTQVTHFMAEEHTAYGVLQGLLILAMLWWTWGGYTWLGNQARATGAGAAGQPVSAPLLLAAVLGVGAAVGLWWLYFDVVSLAAEHHLMEAQGLGRVKIAIEAYSYGHFPIVAGIVLAALGFEGGLAHAGESEPLGAFYAAALFGGPALYLAGHLLFKHTIHRLWSVQRLAALAALLVSLPAASILPPLAGLTAVVVILATLIIVETRRYSGIRTALRGASR